MAKIFGIEVKNVKNLTDHEGMGIHAGNIYMDGKKIGTWHDGYYGESADVDVGRDAYKELQNRANKLYSISKFKSGGKVVDCKIFDGEVDILLSQLVGLKEHEKKFSKFVKDGFASMIMFESHGFYASIGIRHVFNDWETRFSKQIAEVKARFPQWCLSDMRVVYYTSLDDFIVDDSTTSYMLF